MRGVRVLSKTVPVVTEVPLPHPAHMILPSPVRHPAGLPQVGQTKPEGNLSHARWRVSLRCYVEIDSRKRQLPQLSPFAAVVLRLVSCRPIRDRVQENLFRRSSRSLGVFLRWSPPGPRAGAIFSLEEIPAFSLVVVAAPVDRLVRLGIARDMLRAMDVCLGYGD